MTRDDPKIAPLIRLIRGQRVILDADLAALYGVPTKQFNQAFRRNCDRFPVEFAFPLSAPEFGALNWSQSAASSDQGAVGNVVTEELSLPVRNLRKHRGATCRPWPFTEHGALMAANILRSTRALFLVGARRPG